VAAAIIVAIKATRTKNVRASRNLLGQNDMRGFLGILLAVLGASGQLRACAKTVVGYY
jgi:hypothetical protein